MDCWALAPFGRKTGVRAAVVAVGPPGGMLLVVALGFHRRSVLMSGAPPARRRPIPLPTSLRP